MEKKSEVSKVEEIATPEDMEKIKAGEAPSEDKFEKVLPSDLPTMSVGSTKSKYREMRNREVALAQKHHLENATYELIELEDDEAVKGLEPKYYDEGFMVSFQTTNGEGFNKERRDLQLTDEEYDSIVDDLIRDLTDIQGNEAKPHIGIYGGISEISFKVDSYEMAMKIAKKYNQISIWDNARGAFAASQDSNPDLTDEEKAQLWAAANLYNEDYDWKTNQVYKAKK